MSKSTESKKGWYVVIAILLSFSWGIPSLIRGEGFLNGIKENLFAAITLGMIGLFIFVIFSKK